jgi:hypothetical protein
MSSSIAFGRGVPEFNAIAIARIPVAASGDARGGSPAGRFSVGEGMARTGS